MTAVVAFLRAHWRPVALGLSLVLAFVLGRFTAPESLREHAEYRDRVATREAQVAAKAETLAASQSVVIRRHVAETTTKRPTGEVVTTRTEDTAAGSVAAVAEARTEVRYVDRVEYRDRESIRDRVVTHAADWRVSALVGVPVSLKPLGLGAVAYGAHVQRRIVGPVSAGVWGISSGSFGVSVGLDF